jgi:CubicO group peptidase (beta-lactamase class C family)
MNLSKLYLLLLLALISNGCLVNDELNKPYESFVPQDIEDGLELSYPSAENIDSDALEQIYLDLYDNEDLWPIRSMLVFRNGKLVAETYLKDENHIVEKNLIWSCTKQVMGVLTGIALEQQVISSLSDSIGTYLNITESSQSEKYDITIEDLLTMKSGIEYSNDGLGGQTDLLLRKIPKNMTEFILDLPQKYIPGKEFDYKDGDPNLLSAIIQNSTNRPTDEWADEALFCKIGFTNYDWVRYKDGTTFGGFGLVTTPRELSKIALLVADSGRWKGEQIVSSDWITNMLAEQANAEDSEFSFGYYWWLDKTRNIQFMWGHGGQFAFIVPDKDMIVVMTSIPNTQGDYQIDANEALKVVDKIIEISQ